MGSRVVASACRMSLFCHADQPLALTNGVAESKAFFSEEKNQKTLSDAVADLSCGTNP